FVQLLVDDLQRSYADDPARAEVLRRLLVQEFQERIMHITDFFVQGREELLREQEAAYHEELLEQEASYRRAIDRAPACILWVDAGGATGLAANPPPAPLPAHTPGELPGRALAQRQP